MSKETQKMKKRMMKKKRMNEIERVEVKGKRSCQGWDDRRVLQGE